MPFGPCYIPYTVCLTFQDLKLSQAGHTLKSLLQAVRLSSNTVLVAIFLCCPMDLAALSVFVTRLAVTFGLRQQRLQCRSCKGSCQGPCVQVPYWPETIPSFFERRSGLCLHCPVIIFLVFGVIACTHTIMDLRLLVSMKIIVSYNTCFW